MEEYFCPGCGEEMQSWNQGIYECEECGCMIDTEALDELED